MSNKFTIFGASAFAAQIIYFQPGLHNMRKFLTAIVVLLTFSITAFSQTKGYVEMGATLGYNLSNVAVTPYTSNYSFRSGFNLGVSGEYYFTEQWGLAAKLLYDEKGWNNGFIILAGQQQRTTDYQINYITLPIMASLHFGKTKNWYARAGFYLGFLVDAKETSANTNLKPLFSGLDVGGVGAIGVKFPLTKTVKFFIESDVQPGLKAIFTGNSGDEVYGLDARNYRIGINLGVNFPLK